MSCPNAAAPAWRVSPADLTPTLTPTGLNRSEARRYSLKSECGADGEIRTPGQRFTKPWALISRKPGTKVGVLPNLLPPATGFRPGSRDYGPIQRQQPSPGTSKRPLPYQVFEAKRCAAEIRGATITCSLMWSSRGQSRPRFHLIVGHAPSRLSECSTLTSCTSNCMPAPVQKRGPYLRCPARSVGAAEVAVRKEILADGCCLLDV